MNRLIYDLETKSFTSYGSTPPVIIIHDTPAQGPALEHDYHELMDDYIHDLKSKGVPKHEIRRKLEKFHNKNKYNKFNTIAGALGGATLGTIPGAIHAGANKTGKPTKTSWITTGAGAAVGAGIGGYLMHRSEKKRVKRHRELIDHMIKKHNL